MAANNVRHRYSTRPHSRNANPQVPPPGRATEFIEILEDRRDVFLDRMGLASFSAASSWAMSSLFCASGIALLALIELISSLSDLVAR